MNIQGTTLGFWAKGGERDQLLAQRKFEWELRELDEAWQRFWIFFTSGGGDSGELGEIYGIDIFIGAAIPTTTGRRPWHTATVSGQWNDEEDDTMGGNNAMGGNN